MPGAAAAIECTYSWLAPGPSLCARYLRRSQTLHFAFSRATRFHLHAVAAPINVLAQRSGGRRLAQQADASAVPQECVSSGLNLQSACDKELQAASSAFGVSPTADVSQIQVGVWYRDVCAYAHTCTHTQTYMHMTAVPASPQHLGLHRMYLASHKHVRESSSSSNNNYTLPTYVSYLCINTFTIKV